jgi:hypothetical protein
MDEEIRGGWRVSKRQLYSGDWRVGGWVCQPSLGGSGFWGSMMFWASTSASGTGNVMYILKHQCIHVSRLF